MNDLVTAPESENAPSFSILGASATGEFIRYFIASALALVADVGSLALLTEVLHINYLLAGGVSFLLGLAVVYVLSVRWVFEHRAVRTVRHEFLLFALIGVVGLGVNELVLWALTDLAGLYYMFSKAASVVAVFSWNFGARKYMLFSSRV